MKHIKSYKLFEGVIKPYDFDGALEELKSLPNITKEDLKRTLSPLNVEFVDLEYFKSKLETQKEIELVPERPMMGGLRFAAFNYYTNKMYMVVYMWHMFLGDLNNKHGEDRLFDLIREILRHESIHLQQDERRKKKGVLLRHLEDSPEGLSTMSRGEQEDVTRKYFSSSDEIMAYAQSFIDQCKKRKMSDDEILHQISKKSPSVSWIENIYNNLPYNKEPKKTGRFNPLRVSEIERKNALRRFKKYVYQYIQEGKPKTYRFDEL